MTIERYTYSMLEWRGDVGGLFEKSVSYLLRAHFPCLCSYFSPIQILRYTR